MVDASTLEKTYKFLLFLKNNRYYNLENIRIKFFGYIQKPYSKIYPTLSDFVSDQSDILNAISKGNYCAYGPYPIVEDIIVHNTNLPFNNSFIITNVSGSFKLRERIQYDDERQTFYLSEIERYKDLLTLDFNTYVSEFNQIKLTQDNLYVDSCYVDDDYV